MLNPSSIVSPTLVRPNSITISPQSFEAMSGGGYGRTLLNNGFNSGVWPTTNLAILFPIALHLPFTIASLWCANGTVASGNFDIAVYDDGQGTSTVNRLVSIGSTAQSGTNVPQSVAAAYTLLPGTYYLAMCMDNTTGTVLSKAPAAANRLAAMGCAQVANGAVTLGATLTLAAIATAYIPLFGISQKVTV